MAEQVVEVEVKAKPWWKSRIIIANILGGAAELAQMFAGAGILPVGAVSLAVNGITIVLRHMTSQPLQPIVGDEKTTMEAVIRPQPMKFVSIEKEKE